MSGWDLTIYIICALQIATIAAVIVAILKLINGPIGKTIGTGKTLYESVMVLVASGKRVGLAHRGPFKALVNHFREMKEDIQLETGEAAFADEPINYARLAGLLTTIKTIRSGLNTLQGFRNRKAVVAPVAERPVKKSFPDRLGLIPPAARHVAPAMRVAKVALQTHRELRRRGIL